MHSVPGEGSVFTLMVPMRLVPQQPAEPRAVAPLDLATPEAPSGTPSTVQTGPTAGQPAPVPAGSSASAIAAVAQPVPVRAGPRSILVIEDDKRFAQILCDLAREMDFECHLAHNAADGLAFAAQSLPSAIVLDVNLPDFSGLGVLDQLKRNPATRHIPVHVVSVASWCLVMLIR